MKVIKIVLWLLIGTEFVIQIVQTYWWYTYKGITYYLLVKDSTLPYIERILLISIAIVIFCLLIRWVTNKQMNYGK